METERNPSNSARELQVFKLDDEDVDVVVRVREPARFAAAYMHVQPSGVIDPTTNLPMPPTVSPAVAFDTLSTGRLVDRHLVLVPLGRMYDPKPGKRLDFLGAFINPKKKVPVAVYLAVDDPPAQLMYSDVPATPSLA